MIASGSSTFRNAWMICGELSTASTATLSCADSILMHSAVPRLARSIFCLPPFTGIDMLPDRSSATAIATRFLRCSSRSSIEIGRTSSSGLLK